jgi:transposase InsO family protein
LPRISAAPEEDPLAATGLVVIAVRPMTAHGTCDVERKCCHSDRGVQYRAVRYTERLAGAMAVTSVRSKGDSYDNAMAETLNSLFKAECIRNPVMRPRALGRTSATSRSPSPSTSTV